MPYAAYETTHQLRDKDIVVMGSDGLFDNLYTADILECLLPQYSGTYSTSTVTGLLRDVQAAATCIASRSEEKSNQTSYLSPFARGAMEAGVPFRGGKPDDITVIVAQVDFKYQ